MAAIYLAAKYRRQEELCDFAKDLEMLGHTVTSRWIRGDHDAGDMDKLNDPKNLELAARFAREDLADLFRANWLISFSEEPSTAAGRGGRHVELGAALAWGKRIIIIGRREHVFACLPYIERYDTWDQFLREGETLWKQ